MNNRGYLGVILMHALDTDIITVQDWLDWIDAYCKRNGYVITVEKIEKT